MAAPRASQQTPVAPEAATGRSEKAGWIAKKFMVAAANPLAADAGYRMLAQGGAAIDAAIATELVLALVEPQSSGLGGGAFLLHFDGQRLQAFDGRETAPAAADEHLFQDAAGKAISFEAGVLGGRAVGAPGLLRMLDMAHRQHGKLPWKILFGPAIALAENGFAVSPRLHKLLLWDAQHLRLDPVARAYFFDKAERVWPVGHILKNPAMARTLREVAEQGAEVFYTGHIAADIAAKVAHHPSNPGLLTAADIRAYRPVERTPLCSDYLAYSVCGMPPPSSSGVAIAQMLGILEIKNIHAYPPVEGQPAPMAVHLFSEAGRLAFADRNRYIADTDFVPLPGRGVASLIDKAYLAQRAALIGESSMGRASAGEPPGMAAPLGLDNAIEHPSTSHLAVVDADGACVSMTSSIEDAFGTRQMVDGFLLNNHLTDFSFDSRDQHGPIANRVQAGKRPRSSMAPTMVFERSSHKLVLAIGSPGGPSIINYVAKVLVGTLDWGLNVQQAINLPNFGSANGPTVIEEGVTAPGLAEALRARGHLLRVGEQNSGLHGIMRMRVDGQDVWFGGADPRREGVARGQ
ncbi:MAG: gamma-glutamyltransferase [Pseudomonadota bacterium]